MLAAIYRDSFSRNSLPVCLGGENSHGLVSLWDIVNKFDAFGFGAFISLLQSRECQYSEAQSKRSGDDPITKQDREQFESLRRRASELCQQAQFVEALIRIDMIEQYVNAGKTLSVIRFNIQSLTQEIIIALRSKKFLFIAADRREFLDNEELLGDGITTTFPASKNDIIEVGNCLAAECNTAAMFHLMRVAEHGLRVLARRVGVRLTHKQRPCPVEFAEWEKIICGTRAKIEATRQMRIGKRRKEQLQMFSSAADHCEYMRDIWRNDLSHAGKPYIRTEALAALAYSHRRMSLKPVGDDRALSLLSDDVSKPRGRPTRGSETIKFGSFSFLGKALVLTLAFLTGVGGRSPTKGLHRIMRSV